MESLSPLAGRFDAAAAGLVDAGRRLTGAEPSPAALGADAPGRLGELGRALHGQWAGALGARAREAAAVSMRLAEAAGTLRAAVADYAGVDDTARRRQPEEA
ncbi:hypothetical protein WEI85_41595 [Actinomycetes bacterium KLBMP 9797]